MARSATASRRAGASRKQGPTPRRHTETAARAPYVQPQRWAIAAVLVIGGVVFWRATHDIFNLTRATLMGFAILVLVVLAVLRSLESGRALVPVSPALWITLAFVVGIVVAAITAPDTADGLIGPYHRYTGALMYLGYAALLLFVLRVHDRASVEGLAWVAVVTLAVVTAYGLVQTVDADPFEWPASNLSTVFSTFGQVNFAGGYVGVMFPLALWGALGGRGAPWVRIGCAALAAGALWFAFETSSFQAIVATTAGSAVFAAAFLAERRPWDRFGPRRRTVAIAGGAALLAVALLVVGVLSARIEDEIRQGSEERLLMWEAAGEMISEQPLIGHGMSSFNLLFSQYRPAEHAAGYGTSLADAPHSVPLDLAVSGGLLLLLPYLAFVGYTGWALLGGLRRAAGPDRLLLGGFGGAWAAYQVQSLVSLDVPPLASAHWIFAGAVIVIARPPALREIQLPWRGARPNRRGRGATVAGGIRAAQIAVVVVALAVAWIGSRPLRADFIVSQAGAKTARGDVAGAIADLEQATDLAPWEGTYWGAMATLLQPAGRPAEALAAGQRASAESPGTVQFMVTVARLARQQGEKELAFEWYERANQSDPNNAVILEEAAQYRLAEGEPEEAVALLRRATDLAPERPSIWLTLGQALVGTGDERAAAGAFERTLALDPQNVVAAESLESVRTG